MIHQLLTKIARVFSHFTNKLTAKTWPKKSIVVYAGTTPYPHYDWSPRDLKKGLGGSEIAVINLSKEWVKLGYQVTVYNSCSEAEGIYDGVTYLHHQHFNRYDTFDILMIWRFPWILYPKTKARQIWLDLHEILLPQQVTPANLAKFQKIFVKSQYHRYILPEIEDPKIEIIPNGVSEDYASFYQTTKENYKLIYASNYTRGLEKMLTYGWPIIQQEIPQATLHIYYGFPAFNPHLPEDQTVPGSRAWREKMNALMAQPGIFEKGKIGVEQLIQEKATSAIHYYACTFQETDCVSIRESALVGCVPVTTTYAALGEKNYSIKVPGNPYLATTQEAVALQIVALLKNSDKLAKIRQEFQTLAQQETWNNIAKTWLNQANE